ncbi:MAG: PD40 domain-containing protein [Xanthomonadales bacterium]|nr:PD40 domain-containing protein [Xanthomonadales bacterium]
MRPVATLAGLLLAAALPLNAAHAKDDKKDNDAKWSVDAAHGPEKRIRFETTEGTWMDLDVSPDGKRIVFDLLGDLYLLPVDGGHAEQLTSGRAWDVQPRFSPDGKEVAFTSDRGGGNNIWRINIANGDTTQVTKENFRLMNNPAWSPDGQYIAARKHFTSERSLGAGEQWLFHKSGGSGLQLTRQKNDQQDQGEPVFSPDGRYLYFSEDMSGGRTFQYNKDPHGMIYAIRRLDRTDGTVETIIAEPGGAVRPQPSPDGKRIAFVRRSLDKSVLAVMDLDSHAITDIWDGLDHDQQEAWAIFGPYANFAWLPDGSAVVIWARGGLWRVDMDLDGSARAEPTSIPFSASIDRMVAQPLRFPQQLDGNRFQPKMIRDVATSPDGKTLVFHAVGSLWAKSLPNGKPQRLTSDEANYEYQPSFSPDGSKLLYTRWNDRDLVRMVERNLADGSERILNQRPGFYYGPRYSPDGSKIVYSRNSGGGLTTDLHGGDTGIYWIPAAGGDSRRVARGGSEPQFSADSKAIYFLSGGGLEKHLKRVGLHGEEPRDLFDLKYVDFVRISPDGKWVAFTELFNAYVAPLTDTGSAIELNRDTKAIPVTRVSQDVGSYLHWSADSRSLHWMVGRDYFSRDLKDAFAFLPGAPKVLPEPKSLKGVDVGLELPTDHPQDSFAFVHARIVTMRDADNAEEVIEDGTLVVRGDSIVAVGKFGDVRVPENAEVIDASGSTIIPGMIDVHAHASNFGAGVVPQQNWAYYANLAYGVTTAHDPSASTEFVFSQSELVKAGRMVGPRIFSTGSILYGADGDFKVEINSLDDARSHLKRMKAHGAFSVKSYNQPRREQHQQINQAARELGMLVVEEGGSTLNHNLPMIIDGVTGIEHNIPVAPLYDDVIQLWKQTDVRNTPTLIVSYGGQSGENYWYQHDDVWTIERLKRFFPERNLQARSVRRNKSPEWDYFHKTVSESVNTLRGNGVKIQVGGHGQLQGLGSHWEVWMLTQGGMSNFNALRAATIDGADYLGLSSQLGSLEAGKRADLVVLNGNPLEDIKHSTDIGMVMVNGRLFNGEDMAEIGGKQRPAPEFYWQQHGGNTAHWGDQFGPTVPCHCPKSVGIMDRAKRHMH